MQTRPELNGTRGTALHQVNGRWVVQPVGGAAELALKGSNLVVDTQAGSASARGSAPGMDVVIATSSDAIGAQGAPDAGVSGRRPTATSSAPSVDSSGYAIPQ